MRQDTHGDIYRQGTFIRLILSCLSTIRVNPSHPCHPCAIIHTEHHLKLELQPKNRQRRPAQRSTAERSARRFVVRQHPQQPVPRRRNSRAGRARARNDYAPGDRRTGTIPAAIVRGARRTRTIRTSPRRCPRGHSRHAARALLSYAALTIAIMRTPLDQSPARTPGTAPAYHADCSRM